MASNDEDLCTSHADFAVICSFIDKFGEKLGLTLPNIGELQSSLEDTDNVSPLVSQCVSQLLRRINKSVKLDRWERGLQRFAHTYSHQDGWELERFGFKKAKLEVKIRVLKNLLEAQFDLYKSFKDKVNLLSAGELRLQPCGRDKKGVSYWCQLDDCANLRVYSDDQDEETWTLVASTREELVALIAELESESPPGASREMSVDGSRSGTATPMGLSEAPTPVDSKAPTPVASGRTSPVIDTGQDRDSEGKDKSEEIVKITAKVEVEKVKEKLEGENVQKVAEEDIVKVKLEVGEKVKEKLEGDVREKQADKAKQKAEECRMLKAVVREERTEKENAETKLKESVVKTVQDIKENKNEKLDTIVKTEEKMEMQEKAVEQISGKLEEKGIENLSGKIEELEKNKEKIDEKEKVCLKEKEKEKVCLKEKEKEKVCLKEKEKEKARETEETVNSSETADTKDIKRKVNEKETVEKIEEKQIIGKTEDKEKIVQKVDEKKEVFEKPDNKENVHGKLEEKGTYGKVKENEKSLGQMEAKEVTVTPVKTEAKEVTVTPVKTEEKEKTLVKVEKEDASGNVEVKENTSGKIIEKDRTSGEVRAKENGVKLEEREKTGIRTEASENVSCKLQEKGKTLLEMEGSGSAKIKEEVGSTKDRLPELEEQRPLVKNTVDDCKVPISDVEKKEVTNKPVEHLKQSPAMEKGVLGSGLKIERKPEPVTAYVKPDDATKDICKDIAAKREMVVKERIGSQDIHEVKDRGKVGLLEKVEGKKKESVWDKLNKMKEKGEMSTLEKEPTFKDKPKRIGELEKKDNEINEKENSSKESSFIPHLVTGTILGQQTSKISTEQGTAVSKDEKEKTVKKEPHKDKHDKEEEKVVQAAPVSIPNIGVAEKLAFKVSDSSQKVLETKMKDKQIVSSVESATTPQRETPREGPSLMSVGSLASSSSERSFNIPVTKPFSPSTLKAPLHNPIPSMKDADIAEPPQKKLKVTDIKSSESQIESPKENIYPSNVIHQQQESVGVLKATGKMLGAQIERKLEKIDKAQIVQDSVTDASSTRTENLKTDASSTRTEKLKTDASSTRTEKLKTECAEQTKSVEEVRPIAESMSNKTEEKVGNQSVPDSDLCRQEKKLCDKSGGPVVTEKVVITKDVSLSSGASKCIKMETEHGAEELEKQSRLTDKPLSDKPLVVEKNVAFVKDEKMEVEMRTTTESKPSKVPQKEEVKESSSESMKMEVESSSNPSDNTPKLSESILQTPVKYSPSKDTNTEFHRDKEKKDMNAKDATGLVKTETTHKDAAGEVKIEANHKDATGLVKVEMHHKSDKVIPESTATAQEVGEAIEEPLMLVKGDGEGAPCEEGNPLHNRFMDEFRLPIGKPWWECFNESDCSRKIQVEEAVEEDVMYVWGDGNGVDCDAGNNGDETETNTETKQAEGGGSGTAVTTDGQGNSAPSDCKPQKDVESIRTESDLKEVDGVAGSDEAKVNGLRTIDSVEKTDKSISWQLKSESVTDVKHLSVNGKKADGQNCVCNDKDDSKSPTVSEKDDRKQEGNKKQCDAYGKGDSESVISDNTEIKGKEKKSEIDGGNDPSGEKVELKNGENEEKVEKRLDDKSKGMEVRKGRDSCSELNNRNKPERDGRRQNSDESNEDEEERYEDSSKEEDDESLSTRRGRRRSLVQRRGARGRGRLQKRTSEQHPQGSDGEEDDGNHDEDNEEEVGRDMEEDRNDTPPPSKKRRQRGKGSAARPLPDGNYFIAELIKAPRQRSARIAKIREKEEQERRHLEALRLKQLAEENRLRELKKKAREERRSQREMKKGRREKKEKKDREKRKRKRKKRGKKRTNPNDPWAHSSTSSSSEEEEEEDLEEEEEEEKLIFKSDHEFSPESDIEEADAQPIKRARTAKKVTTESEVEDEDEEEEEEEDQTQCTKCGHDDHPETILLCDNCDAGWHLSCLRPPLLSVPEGDWVCPTCEHVHLVNKLRALLHEFDECQKRAHNEELRRQRLAYVNVSLSNVIPDGRRKRKKADGDEDDEDESGSESDTDDSDSESDDSSGSSSQSSTDSTAPLYTLRARSSRTLKEQVEDFDEMINEAIRDEMEAAAGAGNAGRGKDIDNIIQANDEEVEEKEEKHSQEKVEGEENELENKEAEKEVIKKEEDVEGKREREGDDDEDEDEVAPKRKKPKPAEKGTKGSGDDDYKESDEQHEESDSDDVKMTRKQGQKYFNICVKKRRRLTDLDAEDDDDASDEDFMNTSEEEEEETEESAESSSSITTEMETDDSDVVGGKRRRSSRWDSLPLRRSARNRRGGHDDDSENEERYIKKHRNKKKRRKRSSTEDEDEDMSSDSERSYRRKRKIKKKPLARSRGKKGAKIKAGKKQTKPKPKPKKETGEDGEEEKKPSKPRIKYSKPPKPKTEDHEEEVTQRRVTRGRQVNYFDALMMSDETEEEEPKKKWRGKVMKGERAPTESSEYEASDDERMKRRGVSGGLGRGKVMKGEEEDEENKLGQGKKKRGRPKKGDELIGKPSPTRPSAIVSTEPIPVSTTPPVPSLPIMSSVSVVPVTPVVTTAPAASSPAHNTPEPVVSTPPTTPAPIANNKGISVSIAATNVGSSSPVHQPVGKWSPHVSGVSGTPGTPPRPSVGSGPAPGAGTPPRPGLSGPSVTASPPPPYRSSPLPVTPGGPGAPPSCTAPSSLPPVVPPTTTSTHSPSYPPYRPPPEHFPAHPAFPGYAPPGRHSPSPHGVPPRHPAHLPPGHSLPRMPSNYGPPPLTSAPGPGQGPYASRGVPPHPGVLRGPPHDLYRPPLSGLPGHGSPSHPGHPHLVMKPGYPGLEPLPYPSSPGPSPISLHQGSQGSPAHHSPSEDSKDETHPTGKGPGEFSSGLMSYFSSQRDDDIE
ncbi:uncharacterized protein [Panulirus ornatus]|uniref:uncharacterized protein isoform X2 n=1 Tax=Panulirus ornatus TaxID=150431 RepID=UPI003A8399B0